MHAPLFLHTSKHLFRLLLLLRNSLNQLIHWQTYNLLHRSSRFTFTFTHHLPYDAQHISRDTSICCFSHVLKTKTKRQKIAVNHHDSRVLSDFPRRASVEPLRKVGRPHCPFPCVAWSLTYFDTVGHFSRHFSVLWVLFLSFQVALPERNVVFKENIGRFFLHLSPRGMPHGPPAVTDFFHWRIFSKIVVMNPAVAALD